MKFKVGDKVRVTHRLNGHRFDIGQVVEITEIDLDNDYRCANGHVNWYLKEDEFELVESKLNKYRILSVDDVDVNRGFYVGQIIEAEPSDRSFGNVRVNGKYTLFGHQVQLVQEGENKMDMKHDGYVVLSLTDGLFSYNLTKEQAEEEVDFYLKDGVDAENILVFPPNSNLPFSHGVKLIEGE